MPPSCWQARRRSAISSFESHVDLRLLLVSDDVVGRRGRVSVHEQFARNIYKAQWADKNEEQSTRSVRRAGGFVLTCKQEPFHCRRQPDFSIPIRPNVLKPISVLRAKRCPARREIIHLPGN